MKQLRANANDVKLVRIALDSLNNVNSWPMVLGIPETFGLNVKKQKFWFDRIPTNKFLRYFTTVNAGYDDKLTSVERIFRHIRAEFREQEQVIINAKNGTY